MYHPGIHRSWLYAGIGCLGISFICFLYCVLWLSCIKKVKSDNWEDYNSFVIPIATVAIILGCGLICRGLWPVWSVLTFPIVGIQIYGFVIFVAMIPGGFS